ncbi:MAG TPA: hypothetical protein VLX91_03240 [Candidatus Acidoferrales bacterium]|nr:hypothetical protein [Candidatus Acidoferrales bacterium]
MRDRDFIENGVVADKWSQLDYIVMDVKGSVGAATNRESLQYALHRNDPGMFCDAKNIYE